MEKLQLGTKVKRLGIPRLLVGDGMKCRVVLLDACPRMKHIAFDEERKKKVEVDQDMVIKFGLRPHPTYYYLVAKLNTDLNGTIIGDQFSVEYLQLSENLNNEFADSVQELGKVPESISLVKIKKSVEGKDFSYIKPTPSSIAPDNPSLVAKLEELRSNEQFIDGCWKMIDADTSLSKEQYIALLDSENGKEPLAKEKPAIKDASAAVKAIESPVPEPSRHFNSEEFSTLPSDGLSSVSDDNDFGSFDGPLDFN